MGEATPEDRSREIERLWARVGTALPAASTPGEIAGSLPTQTLAGAELAWDTVSLLKRQQRQREETWERAAAARDESARVLRERLEAAEAELARRRESRTGDEERLLIESLDAQERIEAAQKALLSAGERHDQEREILEGALRGLRERLAAESGRARAAEQRWQERELQRESELRELQILADRRKEDAASAQKQTLAAREGLLKAKDALERTLAELLLERRSRAESERERAAAVKRVDELQAHVEGLQKLWEDERAQWGELWKRERSTWEERRAELARWEDGVRREREEWRAEREAETKAQDARAEEMSRRAEEAALAAARVDERLRELGPTAPSAESAAAAPAVAPEPAPVPRWRRALRGLFPFADF
jgi:hypothetical protein